jgi:hypothetical protein
MRRDIPNTTVVLSAQHPWPHGTSACTVATTVMSSAWLYETQTVLSQVQPNHLEVSWEGSLVRVAQCGGVSTCQGRTSSPSPGQTKRK